MSKDTERNVVKKIKDDMDRREIYATTYQMRPVFVQFRDACAREQDVFNYFSLAFAADLCPKGGRVLDMCCGRGLLIPFLRYRNKPDPSLYVGVDLEPKNAIWKDGCDPRRTGKQEKQDGWDFDLVFVEASVGEMVKPLRRELGDARRFDLITYTSSIEHMQPNVQQASLKAAAAVAAPKAKLYLTCPVTKEGADGYDCQYYAHVYEPKDSELKAWLAEAGWQVEQEIGLVTKARVFRERLSGAELDQAEALYAQMPREQALPMIAQLYPQAATEKAYVCTLHEAGDGDLAGKAPAAGAS